MASNDIEECNWLSLPEVSLAAQYGEPVEVFYS